MTTSLRSEELNSLLAKVYKQGTTGFISVTVQDGARPIYGTMQVLNGQLLAAQFRNATGRLAVEQIAGLEAPEVSFASSSVSAAKDADIPSITEIIDLSKGARSQARPRRGTARADDAAQPKKGLSVRSKMLLLFSVLPMIILAGLGAFSVSQISNMSNTLTTEADTIVRDMAEDQIQLVASSVAAEVGRYLAANPGLTKTQFQTSPAFKQIALQRVGETGYTTLMEEASGAGDTNNLFFWVHPDDRIIGAPLAALAGQLGDNFTGLAALLDQAAQAPGNVTNGDYDWVEADGSVREKHLASARITGTPFYIAATTYIDEFTQPMVALEENSNEIVDRNQLFVIIAVVAAMLFTLFSVASYGNRLSKKIQAISDVADAISMGNLDTDIEGTERSDEIGMLARALERLRVSVQVMFTELRAQ